MKRRPLYSYAEMDRLIAEHVVGKRAKRDREILRSYFLDGCTYEEIAEAFDMSANQIGRIVRGRGDPLLLMIDTERW